MTCVNVGVCLVWLNVHIIIIDLLRKYAQLRGLVVVARFARVRGKIVHIDDATLRVEDLRFSKTDKHGARDQTDKSVSCVCYRVGRVVSFDGFDQLLDRDQCRHRDHILRHKFLNL